MSLMPFGMYLHYVDFGKKLSVHLPIISASQSGWDITLSHHHCLQRSPPDVLMSPGQVSGDDRHDLEMSDV